MSESTRTTLLCAVIALPCALLAFVLYQRHLASQHEVDMYRMAQDTATSDAPKPLLGPSVPSLDEDSDHGDRGISPPPY